MKTRLTPLAPSASTEALERFFVELKYAAADLRYVRPTAAMHLDLAAEALAICPKDGSKSRRQPNDGGRRSNFCASASHESSLERFQRERLRR